MWCVAPQTGTGDLRSSSGSYSCSRLHCHNHSFLDDVHFTFLFLFFPQLGCFLSLLLSFTWCFPFFVFSWEFFYYSYFQAFFFSGLLWWLSIHQVQRFASFLLQIISHFHVSCSSFPMFFSISQRFFFHVTQHVFYFRFPHHWYPVLQHGDFYIPLQHIFVSVPTRRRCQIPNS